VSKALVPRRFSNEEVARILRRAAELQTDPTGRHPSSLTVSEVERMAEEAGIARDRLHAAIAELHGRARLREGSRILGAPTRIYVERVVPFAITEEALEDLVAEVRRILEDTGSVSLLGKTLTWSSTIGQTNVTPTSVTITRREGETRLVVETRLGQLAGGLFGGIGGGVGGGLAVPVGVVLAGLNPILGAAVGISLALGSLGLARTIYRRVARKRLARYHHLCDVLEEKIRDTAMRG
jgi:hypothetical protein